MLDNSTENRAPTLSICILTCDRDDLLKPLLQEMSQQAQPGDEILVLDTGDSDATKQTVSAVLSTQIKYHAFPMEQFDFATARNELLRLAQCDAVAFIDDDAFPFPNWLAQVRSSVSRKEASGGATVADSAMPDWWDTSINWCIGLSPPGTILGIPGHYPDTCNMAADRNLWNRHPFRVIHREDRQLYATGREDAEWWMARRIGGDRAIVNFRQAVAHHVHTDRLTLDYIKQRARNDGISGWLRRPVFEAATDIPWDLAHIAGIVAEKFVRHPFDTHHRLADTIWLHRQFGQFCAVWNSPAEQRPSHRNMVGELGKAALFQLRYRAGEAVFRTINIIRHRGEFPPANPRRIFVSADCNVGDTVLLRRHVQSLAQTFVNSEVLVSCRCPQLMAGLLPNVNALATKDASVVAQNGDAIDAAIIPYFPFGDSSLWRSRLSQIGTTFDCDVAFAARRDTIYARRIINKNFELHEHENLAKLFRLWPLQSTLSPPPPVSDECIEWVHKTISAAGLPQQYILVQFGAGQESKEWPLDCWIPFLRELAGAIELPIVITGGSNWNEAANTAIREVAHPIGMLNITGCPMEQLMALVHQAVLCIGSCSGPKHMAIAFGVPTFTLYAATEPYRWAATEDHHLHGYVYALPQKLSKMELQGLDVHHRIRLLEPLIVAQKAIRHYRSIIRPTQPCFPSE